MRREGYSGWKYCPRCGELCILYDDGLKLRLSRKSVPTKDAAVLGRYSLIVINLWVTAEGNIIGVPWDPWFSTDVPRGWLFVPHHCTIRK